MSVAFDASEGLIVVAAEVTGPTGQAVLRLALDTGATSTLINQGPLIAVGALQGFVQALVTRWIGGIFVEYFKTEMTLPTSGLSNLARREWQKLTSPAETGPVLDLSGETYRSTTVHKFSVELQTQLAGATISIAQWQGKTTKAPSFRRETFQDSLDAFESSWFPSRIPRSFRMERSLAY
jgi:hypothetical protein